MLLPSKHSGYQAGIRLYPGGKGGSSAPPPDPRLIEAQIKSMGFQDDAIKQILATSNEMAPLQKQQMQFGLDSSKTAYDQAQSDRTYALGKRDQLSGFQDKAVREAGLYSSEDYANQQAGMAQSDVQQAVASARESGNRGMARMGVNPSSGRMLAMNNQMALGEAGMTAQASSMARTAARDMGLKYDDRASGMLAGYPSMGMAATGSGAGFGASGLTMANSGLAGMNSGYSAAGGMAGSMGSNASSMYGAMGTYKNGADKIAGDNDPFKTILGAAAGAGMAYMTGGMSLAGAGAAKAGTGLFSR